MRRLVTSDWQLCDNPRDRYRTDFVVDQLPKLIDKYQVDQLLVLGDVTEEKDHHPAALVNTVANAFFELQKKCNVIILEGNHDFLHKEHPYFKFVTSFPNVAWISVPLITQGCLFLPHTRDHKKDWANIDFKGHDFIFAHNIFEGVKANGQSLSGIPRSVFPRDAFVISGDVHEPQTLGVVTYVGSPTLCDFGDDYQPRVLLLDDLKVKSIKVYGQQKRVILCSVTTTSEMDIDFDIGNAQSGDLVKIKVDLLMEHVAHWSEIRQEVEAWAIKNKFIVNSIIPQVAYVAGERQKAVNSIRKTDYQYMDAFVQRTGIDERTALVGKEIIDLV